MEKQSMSEEDPGVARRDRTIAQLKELGIKTLDWRIIRESEVRMRPTHEVAERAVALCATGLQAAMYHHKSKGLRSWQLLDHTEGNYALSPKEQKFFEASNPRKCEIDRFAGCFEASYTLLWALGLHDELGFSTEAVDLQLVDGLAATLDKQGIASVQLRPGNEILDHLDLNCRLHWAMGNTKVFGANVRRVSDPGVAQERYRALKWLTNAGGAEWDDANPDESTMDERHKRAYRRLLYHAMINLRACTPHSWIDLFFHPQYLREIGFANIFANSLHNLARDAADDFAGFNERRFWSYLFYHLEPYPGRAESLQFSFEKYVTGEWE